MLRSISSSVTAEILKLMLAIRTEDQYSTNLHPLALDTLVQVMLDCPERPKNHIFNVEPISGTYNEVCLTSGGADSTIAWCVCNRPHGLYIDIGQPYAMKELEALHTIGIPYQYIDLKAFGFGRATWKHIIPGRNLLFLTIAAETVSDNGTVVFSVVNGEGFDSDKGDKSSKFIRLFEEWYLSTTGKNIHIHTMDQRTKGEWLKWFIESGYDLNIIRHKTVTCFSDEIMIGTPNNQCGRCQACVRKFLSFAYNNIDISSDYMYHPMLGGAEHVKKYTEVLAAAIGHSDYSHYSRSRCIEDLRAIKIAEGWLK